MVKFTADIINLIKDTYGDYLSSLSRNPAPHVGYIYTVTGFRFSGMGAPFFIRFYRPRALRSLGNQRSAEPQGWYKDGPTAFTRHVTVAQLEELSLPSQNASTTL